MLEKLKAAITLLNSKGIPLPVVRDPVTQKPSVSLTTLVVSFAVCIVGLVGKVAGFLGGVDMTQAITLFGVCAGLYLGRKMSRDTNKVDIDPGTIGQ